MEFSDGSAGPWCANTLVDSGSRTVYNAKLLEEELGVYVEVARGKCLVRHEELVAKIELVMNGTERGIEMTIKACEVRELTEYAMKHVDGFMGSSVKALHEFFECCCAYDG